MAVFREGAGVTRIEVGLAEGGANMGLPVGARVGSKAVGVLDGLVDMGLPVGARVGAKAVGVLDGLVEATYSTAPNDGTPVMFEVSVHTATWS